MNNIREIMRLQHLGLSKRGIATALNISRPVVSDYLQKFRNISYDEFLKLNDDGILKLLNTQKIENSKYKNLESNFPYFLKELKRTGVTLSLLWEEYLRENSDGYLYSRFCFHFNKWKNENKLYMHVPHKAGDKMFVDFTGKHLIITDRSSGKQTEVEVFLAVLGASNYTYVEAVASQKKEDWILANENALHFFGGSPQAIVSDNLRSAINKTSKYEPSINREYLKFAEHYNTVIYPARVYKPKDKSLVEGAVNIIYTRIYAALRNQTFYSLAELNKAIRPLLEDHNNKIMKTYKASRTDLFHELDSPMLKPLPMQRYELKSLQIVKIQFNYHVYLKDDDHNYSVPHRYSGKQVELWYNTKTLEILYKNDRIAVHKRTKGTSKVDKYTTLPEHMPPEHKWIHDWNPDRFKELAGRIGPNAKELLTKILEQAKYPEQSYRSCIGIINLVGGKNEIKKERVDKACKRAMTYKTYSYKSVKNILKNNLEDVDDAKTSEAPLPDHENIRGKDYYKDYQKEN